MKKKIKINSVFDFFFFGRRRNPVDSTGVTVKSQFLFRLLLLLCSVLLSHNYK